MSAQNPNTIPTVPLAGLSATTARSPIGYVGGKRQLSKKIIPLIPTHQTYVEVFGGGGWVLFRKPASNVEILNDINGELVNLYRVLKWHLEEFVRCFKWSLVAREEFQRHVRERPDTLTDIHRAVRFFYLNKLSYGAKVGDGAQHFAISAHQPPRLNLLRIEETLSDVHLRLARVWIENKPYADILKKFDSPETFFYLDPPYWGCENHYGKNIFERADFELLASLLATTKARWMVSLNDTPEVREIFKNFSLCEVTTKYTMGVSRGHVPKQVGELLIANYQLPNTA